MFGNRYVTLAAVVGTLTAVLLAVYAYASTSTITDGGKVAFGTDAIETINVTGTTYTQSSNPIYLASWTLTLSTAASTVQSRVGADGSTGATWVTCTSSTPFTTWLCTPASNTVKMEDSTSLQVSAVKSSP
jgi:hypothetical protein